MQSKGQNLWCGPDEGGRRATVLEVNFEQAMVGSQAS